MQHVGRTAFGRFKIVSRRWDLQQGKLVGPVQTHSVDLCLVDAYNGVSALDLREPYLLAIGALDGERRYMVRSMGSP